MKEEGYAAAVEKIELSEQREYFFGYRKAGKPEAKRQQNKSSLFQGAFLSFYRFKIFFSAQLIKVVSLTVDHDYRRKILDLKAVDSL